MANAYLAHEVDWPKDWGCSSAYFLQPPTYFQAGKLNQNIHFLAEIARTELTIVQQQVLLWICNKVFVFTYFKPLLF